MFSTLIGFGILVVLFCLFLGRKNIKSWLSIGQAQATKYTNKAKAADPRAMMQQTIDEATGRLSAAKDGVAKFKGWRNRLARQVKANKEDVGKLEARMEYRLKNGDQDKAKEVFDRIQSAKTELDENKKQLQDADSQYKQQLSELQRANKDIQNAEAQARKLGAKLELSKARKAAASVASTAGVTGGLGSELSNAADAIQRQIDSADADSEVTYDLNADARADAEEEEAIASSRNDDAFAKMMEARGASTT